MVTALALIATSATVIALQHLTTARAQRDNAILNRVTAQADNVCFPESLLAAQLDLVAHRMRPNAVTT